MIMEYSEEEIKKKLTPEEYKVLREKGTEAPGSGKYVKPVGKGKFSCKVCGNELFSAETQFETKLAGLEGWPSFEDAIPGAVKFVPDDSVGMHRTEVVCAECGSHLGHVFEDGKAESSTGKHYCINSVCLDHKE